MEDMINLIDGQSRSNLSSRQLISDSFRLLQLFLQEFFHLLRLMLHTVLSVLGLRDQGVQLIQVGSHFLVEINLLLAVRGIRDGVFRRCLHRHHFIGFWLLLILLLVRVRIRLLGLVTRRSAARIHLPLEQRTQAAANCLRNSLFRASAFFLSISRGEKWRERGRNVDLSAWSLRIS